MWSSQKTKLTLPRNPNLLHATACTFRFLRQPSKEAEQEWSSRCAWCYKCNECRAAAVIGRPMAYRKTSPRLDDAVSLAGELRLGSYSLIFDDDEVIQLLRAAVEREGNQGAFARRHGINRSHLILNGKRDATGIVVKALLLRKVYAPK
jgi:hypothetical protein